MARLEDIRGLAESHASSISSSPRDWMNYLDTAARLYRYPFMDQFLIHAQRPQATACASLELWNQKMFRWVNRGAKGIALIDETTQKTRLRYVFDVQDTHMVNGGRTPYLWKLQEEQQEEVLLHLEEVYGLEKKDTENLSDALMATAKYMVEENLDEYLDGLMYVTEGTYLEELEEDTICSEFRSLLTDSIYYTLASRCGLDPMERQEEMDFVHKMCIRDRDNQLQQELQELIQEKEDEPGENSSGDSFIEVDAGILALHEENPDCIGWLTIEGTKIDYPVMYRPGDKNYYLHRDFNGDYSANGCLFLAEECVPGDSDNLIIYGHHMNSGKMFADLEKYKDKGFYEEHPTILFRTIWGNEQYQILSAFTTPVYTGNDFNYYSFIKAQKGAGYEYFIREIKRKAIYETGITAEYGDKLLTLSTCEYSQRNGRMVVVAKKIQQNES